MPCTNAIADYDCIVTQTDQLSMEKDEKLKTLNGKSAWQIGNSKCETDHIPFKKDNEQFLNKSKQKDNPGNETAMQPDDYLEPQDILTRVETVIAKFTFHPQRDGELTLQKGDIVEVLEKREDGWWKGRLGQKMGWFPSNYIQMKETSTKPESISELTSPLADNPENHGAVKQSSEHLFPQNPVTDSETVNAKYTFLPQNQDDLALEKEDNINVPEKQEDSWWKGRVGQKGRFHAYIQLKKESAKPASTSEPASAQEHQKPPFSSKKWFWGKITKVQAEKLLNETAADGDFLVREIKTKVRFQRLM